MASCTVLKDFLFRVLERILGSCIYTVEIEKGLCNTLILHNMEPKITGNRYVLAVNNLEKSTAFYKNKLGFRTVWEGGGWHFLTRDAINIMLGECPDDKPASEINCHSYFAYFEVENIDELFKEYQLQQVEILSDIENKPWGQREFSIRTVDGHRITFGEIVSTDGFDIKK
jgi:catechol 2,3-dioxygenase-like lactoylglutathione lyase family enzyme